MSCYVGTLSLWEIFWPLKVKVLGILPEGRCWAGRLCVLSVVSVLSFTSSERKNLLNSCATNSFNLPFSAEQPSSPVRGQQFLWDPLPLCPPQGGSWPSWLELLFLFMRNSNRIMLRSSFIPLTEQSILSFDLIHYKFLCFLTSHATFLIHIYNC